MPAEHSPPAVLFVITTLGPGGAETQLVRLALALRAGGWRVAVAALGPPTDLRSELVDAGVPVSMLTQPGSKVGLGTLRSLVRELRRVAPDCVVTFLLQANVVGRLAAAWCRVPVVSSIRNVRFGGAGPLGPRIGDLLERLTNPLAHAVVTNASAAADELVARGVARARTLRVIPNALPPRATRVVVHHDRAVVRADLGVGPTDFVWLSAGRLEPQKNYLGLLGAIHALVRERPQARLWIAGDGSMAPTLRSAARASGLDHVVRFLGLRRDLPDLYRLADGFVLASAWEGLPNVVLEALAAGLPTVATPVGGVPELVIDGETGWLAASPRPEHLLRAMRCVMDLPERRREAVAVAGTAHVQAGYGLDAVVSAWREVIEEAIVVRRGGSR
jgi:glycosyltransferase involved in cell wall biosynthesis